MQSLYRQKEQQQYKKKMEQRKRFEAENRRHLRVKFMGFQKNMNILQKFIHKNLSASQSPKGASIATRAAAKARQSQSVSTIQIIPARSQARKVNLPKVETPLDLAKTAVLQRRPLTKKEVW